MKKFKHGWSRGLVVKFVKNKNPNTHISWGDENGAIRSQMMTAEEYHEGEGEGVCGARSFLSILIPDKRLVVAF